MCSVCIVRTCNAICSFYPYSLWRGTSFPFGWCFYFFGVYTVSIVYLCTTVPCGNEVEEFALTLTLYIHNKILGITCVWFFVGGYACRILFYSTNRMRSVLCLRKLLYQIMNFSRMSATAKVEKIFDPFSPMWVFKLSLCCFV